MFNFFGLSNGRAFSAGVGAARRRPGKPSGPRYIRPCLEGFEDRVVPAPVLAAAQVAPAAPVAASLNNLVNITGVQLTNLHLVNGVLTGAVNLTGTLAGLPITNNPVGTFTLTPNPHPGQCAILNLHLDPIHLELLGLHVDTSPICLDITANPHQGLLGQVLCGLADNLNGILPNTTALQNLENLLGQVLNGALNSASAGHGHGHGHGHGQSGNDVCTGQNEVLDLTLGPVNLNLLGLHVSLDNCSGGPVEVCVSATPSEGLLGSVLSSLSNSQLTLAEITQLITLLNV